MDGLGSKLFSCTGFRLKQYIAVYLGDLFDGFEDGLHGLAVADETRHNSISSHPGSQECIFSV